MKPLRELDKVIDKFFESKEEAPFSASSLLELIEEQMNSIPLELAERKSKSAARRVYNYVLGQFKAPTEQAGKFDTDERQRFQRYISKNITGETLADKITSINAIASGATSDEASVAEILASLGALKMLQETLDDFNESTAGFLFEAFLSALLSGEQVTERVGGTLPIEDCMFFVDPKTGQAGQPVSLKLLSASTVIEGSLINLLGFFQRPDIARVAEEKGIEYIVAVKTKGSRLDVYSFTIRPSNFFDWIDEKHFAFESEEFIAAVEARPDAPSEEDVVAESAANDPEGVEAAAKIWMNNVRRYRFPMMGLDPASELKLNWKKITDWRDVIPMPSISAAKAHNVATVMVSDTSKTSFEAFTRPKFGVPAAVIDNLRLPPELEAQFMQNENQEAKKAAAVSIARLARARRAEYLNTIETWGLDQPESPGHIQRYFAVLNPKLGQMKAVDAQQKLLKLVEAGDEQSIIRWAMALEAARGAQPGKNNQFHIKPVTVRGRSTVYGTVNINKRALIRSIGKHSARLESLVLPIYEALNDLTEHINGYFFENRPADAFRASDDAVELKGRTDELVKTHEEQEN